MVFAKRLPQFLDPVFHVRPAVVTTPHLQRTYQGVITLSMTGLTNTETVIIQKRLDLNGNGSMDPGEFMMDTFSIADGGATIL